MYYDFIIDLLQILVKSGGLTVGSLIWIGLLLLKQKKMKNRLKKVIPWMFGDDSEIKEYVQNQLLIMQNQKQIMLALGVEPCVNILPDEPQKSVKKQKMFLPLSWGIITSARSAGSYRK